MNKDKSSQPTEGSFKEAWRLQVLSGLSVSPAQRLRWLEEAMAFAARVGARTSQQIIERRAREAGADRDVGVVPPKRRS